MAQFEKGNTVGNRFDSDNQPKKNGRKPALYNQLKKLTGKQVKHELSKEDYFKIIQYLMERTPAELKTIMQSKRMVLLQCGYSTSSQLFNLIYDTDEPTQ